LNDPLDAQRDPVKWEFVIFPSERLFWMRSEADLYGKRKKKEYTGDLVKAWNYFSPGLAKERGPL
jgi:hypothetical protein